MKFFKSAQEHGATALKGILGSLLMVGLLAGLTPGAQATLIGQTVGCAATDDVFADFKCSTESAVVQSPGLEFNIDQFVQAGSSEPDVLRAWNLDIDANSIVITTVTDLGTSVGINIDVVLSDLFWLGDPDAVITGFNLSVDGVTGFEEADISLFDNAIKIDLAGQRFTPTTWAAGSSATITLITEDGAPSVAVPEPATLALFGLGLAGLGIARRRKSA